MRDRKTKTYYPILCDDSVVYNAEQDTLKQHVQHNLRWGCDRELAEKLCCLNRTKCEQSGYWQRTAFQTFIQVAGDIRSQKKKTSVNKKNFFSYVMSFFSPRKKNKLERHSNPVQITFYDSVTGKPLFIAPRNRTFEEFKDELVNFGRPIFRDDEVVWENVRCLRNGETISIDGTHLGRNLPDGHGNRYCINLVSIAGRPLK